MTPDPVIHLIDDDQGVRQATAFLLAAAGLAVRVYESAEAFLATAGKRADGTQPGCIVTDIRMPGMDGLALLRALRDRDITLPVVVMTGHGDVPLAVAAMKAGAADFIEKPFDDTILLAAIHAALADNRRNTSEAAGRLAVETKLATLTARERAVLDGLVAGLPNKTIAHDLTISPRTVEVHRANVMTKMAAASLSDLVRMMFVAGHGLP